MTLISIVSLLLAMAILAAIPSVSVLTVITRSASSGFVHGAFTSLGIVVGDILFILLAIFGLNALAEAMGEFFLLVKYAGGLYLIWLGIGLWRRRVTESEKRDAGASSLFSSFILGLMITLADQKAILFYFGFLPAFLDLSSMSMIDAGVIIGVTTLAVGGVKLIYAFLADRSSVGIVNAGSMRKINRVAGLLLVGVGVLLVTSR